MFAMGKDPKPLTDVMKASLDKVVKACLAQLELQDVEKVGECM